MTEITRSYADRGYTVFNLNYRLSTDAAWPAQRIDALDAIATAKRHAARWAFDPNNYVVIGFSAGGHIAAAVGTYGNGMPGLKGVVGLSPIISPLRAYTDGATAADPYSPAAPQGGDPAGRRLRAQGQVLAGLGQHGGRLARQQQGRADADRALAVRVRASGAEHAAEEDAGQGRGCR